MRPDLIAVDAVSPGCCRTSIARGVRQLGWSIPVALVVQPSIEVHRCSTIPGDLVFAVDASDAVPAIVAIAPHGGGGQAQDPLAPSGAVPKLTLKRLHQIVTARYLARSTSAGTS